MKVGAAEGLPNTHADAGSRCRRGTLPDFGPARTAGSQGTNAKGEKDYEGAYVSGENACALDPPAKKTRKARPHPPAPIRRRRGRGGLYTLEQVHDPNGPWDGFYYFKEWKVQE